MDLKLYSFALLLYAQIFSCVMLLLSLIQTLLLYSKALYPKGVIHLLQRPCNSYIMKCMSHNWKPNILRCDKKTEILCKRSKEVKQNEVGSGDKSGSLIGWLNTAMLTTSIKILYMYFVEINKMIINSYSNARHLG